MEPDLATKMSSYYFGFLSWLLQPLRSQLAKAQDMTETMVTMRSCLFGSFLAAWDDQKTVRLQPGDTVDDTKRLPANMVWKKSHYSSNKSQFQSCSYYNKYLTTDIFRRQINVKLSNDIVSTMVYGTGYWNVTKMTDEKEGKPLFMIRVDGTDKFLTANADGTVSLLRLADQEAYPPAGLQHFWEVTELDPPPSNYNGQNNYVMRVNINASDPNQGSSSHSSSYNTGGNTNNGSGQQYNGGIRYENNFHNGPRNYK